MLNKLSTVTLKRTTSIIRTLTRLSQSLIGCFTWFVVTYRLGCGTSWHSAGLLGVSRGSIAHTKICGISEELYSNLEEETGLATGMYVRGCTCVEGGRFTIHRFPLFGHWSCYVSTPLRFLVLEYIV